MLISVIINAVIIAFVFGVLIVVHELGHFLAARRVGIKVEKFALGLGKKLLGFRKGDTEYVLNLIPIGGYVKLSGEDPSEATGAADEFQSKPVGKRFWVLFSGAFFNYIFGFLLFIVFFMAGPKLMSDIGGVLDGSPAQKSGIVRGDVITSMDGKKIKFWEDVLKAIHESPDGKPISVEIMRGPEKLDVSVLPTDMVGGKKLKQKLIGVSPSGRYEFVHASPGKAVVAAAMEVRDFTLNTYARLWELITGRLPVKDNIGGPIQIVEILAQSIKYGVISVISIMGYISLALAIFNLLPFPVLDGGHLLFLLVEKIRRKPLSLKAQEIVTQTAVVLLIMFFVYVSYFDTVRLITNLRR